MTLYMLVPLLKYVKECQIIVTRQKEGRSGERKLYQHMRDLGFEHFRILLVREYKEISKERLQYKEDKCIKRFDSVNTGLNSKYSFGNKCEHNVPRSICKQCRGVSICEHNIRKCVCKYCGGSQICEQ